MDAHSFSSESLRLFIHMKTTLRVGAWVREQATSLRGVLVILDWTRVHFSWLFVEIAIICYSFTESEQKELGLRKFGQVYLAIYSWAGAEKS